eukprot:gb/GECG01015595.1/.p1 GENE.gb/GECG01015595.1/~~gb/GECG01015595.1/.p1  ORF type:complete len:848 (+),score=126.49 gb/GECG01015595.1/:1-2544(+)
MASSKARPGNQQMMGGNGQAPAELTPPPFVQNLYRILLDQRWSHVIHWVGDGVAFQIEDTKKFANEVLPQYFNHGNWSSFSRQCSFYAFQKLHSNQLPKFGIKTEKKSHLFIYYHPYFRKGRRDMLNKVVRKTNSSGQALLAAAGDPTYQNGDVYNKESVYGFSKSAPKGQQRNSSRNKKRPQKQQPERAKRGAPGKDFHQDANKKQRVSDEPAIQSRAYVNPSDRAFRLSSAQGAGETAYHAPQSVEAPAYQDYNYHYGNEPLPDPHGLDSLGPHAGQWVPTHEWGGQEHVPVDPHFPASYVGGWSEGVAPPPSAAGGHMAAPPTAPQAPISSSVDPASNSRSASIEQQHQLPHVYDAIQAPNGISQRNYPYPSESFAPQPGGYSASSLTGGISESGFSLGYRGNQNEHAVQSAHTPSAAGGAGNSQSGALDQSPGSRQQASTVGEDFPKTEFSLKDHMFGRGRSPSAGLRSDSFGGGSLYSEFDTGSIFGRSKRSGSRDRAMAGDDSLVGLNCDATTSAPFDRSGHEKEFDDRESTASANALRQASFASSIQAHYHSQSETAGTSRRPTNSNAEMSVRPSSTPAHTSSGSQFYQSPSMSQSTGTLPQSGASGGGDTSETYSKEEVERLTARIQYLEQVMQQYVAVAADTRNAPPVQADSAELRDAIAPNQQLQSSGPASQGDQSEQAALAAAAGEAAMASGQTNGPGDNVGAGGASTENGSLPLQGLESTSEGSGQGGESEHNRPSVPFEEGGSQTHEYSYEDVGSVEGEKERKLSLDTHSIGEISLPSLSAGQQFSQTPSKTWGTFVSTTVHDHSQSEIAKMDTQFGESESHLEAGLHNDNASS